MEPANYCDDVRTALHFMKDHPDLEESVFKGRKVLRFKRKGTEWKEMKKGSGYYYDKNMRMLEESRLLNLADEVIFH